MCPFSPKLPLHPDCHIKLSRVPYAIRRPLLVICLKYSHVHMSVSNSLTIPSPHPYLLAAVRMESGLCPEICCGVNIHTMETDKCRRSRRLAILWSVWKFDGEDAQGSEE